jgi:ubiquinone/menaquinone biosynthesis C-methylase UbiE
MWESLFDEICRFARSKGLEARAFVQRRSEFEILFHNLRMPAGRSLEVGCGDGFLTALLAREGRFAAGVDMAAPDHQTHSRGLGAPARLRRALDAANLHFLGCRGEALCFADATFDLVLSSYVLEHVRDRPQAVREMKRVAKEDGVIVALVPSWMERVYAPLYYYPSMIWGILRSGSRFLMQRFGERRESAAPSSSAPPEEAGERRGGAPEGLREKLRKFFGVYHPTFPFPRPHGLYRSSSEELRAHRFGRWKKLFEGEGLVIERAFATRIAPTCLLEMISDGADRAVQGALAGLVKRHGGGGWMRVAAYSLCFVLRRRPSVG